MSLTILNVAYPLAPVGPDAVGGAEQVLTQLDAALVRAGHHSIVVACAGSVTKGTLVLVPTRTGELDDTARQSAWESHRQAIAWALRRWPVDLVHLHGIDCHHYLPGAGVPSLITLHLPPDWYPSSVFRLGRDRTWLQCVSESQHRACPPCACLLPPIANGVDTRQLRPCFRSKGRFALCLGRICPEKGFHLALNAAGRANVPLILAGNVFCYPEHQYYFQQQILPRLDRLRRFLGPVGFERKRKLLSAASCLLVPSLVPETSSLVAMESLSCGTPVVAFPSGALPEIIESGKTGFIVDNESEMAEAITRISTLSSRYCRAAAESRFAISRMTENYFEVYQRLADSGQGSFSAPGAAWEQPSNQQSELPLKISVRRNLSRP